MTKTEKIREILFDFWKKMKSGSDTYRDECIEKTIDLLEQKLEEQKQEYEKKLKEQDEGFKKYLLSIVKKDKK